MPIFCVVGDSLPSNCICCPVGEEVSVVKLFENIAAARVNTTVNIKFLLFTIVLCV